MPSSLQAQEGELSTSGSHNVCLIIITHQAGGCLIMCLLEFKTQEGGYSHSPQLRQYYTIKYSYQNNFTINIIIQCNHYRLIKAAKVRIINCNVFGTLMILSCNLFINIPNQASLSSFFIFFILKEFLFSSMINNAIFLACEKISRDRKCWLYFIIIITPQILINIA